VHDPGPKQRSEEIAQLQREHHEVGIDGLIVRRRDVVHEPVERRGAEPHAKAHGKGRGVKPDGGGGPGGQHEAYGRKQKTYADEPHLGHPVEEMVAESPDGDHAKHLDTEVIAHVGQTEGTEKPLGQEEKRRKRNDIRGV